MTSLFGHWPHILDAVRDVVNYALELEKAKGNG